MKKFFYLSLVFIGLSFATESKAQIRVNINIGSQPLWGPVGYDYVRYYYIPEIDVYYNVVNKKYTYYQGNRWVTKSKLPNRYKNVDLYRTYKVVLNESDPWRFHDRNRHSYGHYSRNYSQIVIRDKGRVHRDDRMRHDSRNNRRFEKEQRRDHNRFEKDHRQGNNGRGRH